MKRKERVAIGVIILFVGLLVVFFGMRKMNYHTDEVWNYGLANHVGSIFPDIEYGKTYSGLGLFKTFVTVQPGERFNYINVWMNQANDVHPPFYYMVFHTVCSFFADSYSKWYGIGVNMFWMIFILILLYKLAYKVTGESGLSLGFIMIYGTTVAFIDALLFIRMYTQFSFFVIALAYLLKCYWDQDLDRKFYIRLTLVLVLGMLTHYYFSIIAFGLCVSFLVELIINKKTKEIRKCIITGIISGIICVVLFTPLLYHIFGGYRGQEAMGKAASLSGLLSGTKNMLGIVNREVFAGTIYVFIVIGIIYLALTIKNKKQLWRFESALLISGTFFIVVVGKIAPYIVSRYIMPVFFIFLLTAYLSLVYLLRNFVKLPHIEIGVIALFLLINIYNFVNRDFYVPMDYYSEDYAKAINTVEDLDVIYCIKPNEQYGLFDGFTMLTNANSYKVMEVESSEDLEEIIATQKGSYILGTYSDDGLLAPPDNTGEKIYSVNNANFYLVK